VRSGPYLVLLTSLAACGGAPPITDPIPGIPPAQQRVIARYELDWQWPLTVGVGTLGCDSGAVVFRTGGSSYAVNDAARARGFASIEPIHLTQAQGLPSNPLKGVNQDRRMQIFRESTACSDADARCRQQVRARYGLSEADLKQVDFEGVERLWPPLASKRKDLGRLVDAGLKLCPGR